MGLHRVAIALDEAHGTRRITLIVADQMDMVVIAAAEAAVVVVTVTTLMTAMAGARAVPVATMASGTCQSEKVIFHLI